MEQEIKDSIDIAKDILNNKTDPNLGCGQISEISQNNNSPDVLQIFEILSHEQYNHEHIGLTAENTKSQIIEECESLIKATAKIKSNKSKAIKRVGLD